MVVWNGATCAVCLAPACLLRIDETELPVAKGYESAVNFTVEA